MKINQYGLVHNGMAMKRIHQRKARSSGSRMAWDDIKDDPKYVRKLRNGKFKIIKVPYSHGWGQYSSGDAEIGALRMIQSVFPKLYSSKKSFTLKEMNDWIEGIASCEFGVSAETPLSIINPEEKINFGLIPPKSSDDEVYSKIYKVKRGLVKVK